MITVLRFNAYEKSLKKRAYLLCSYYNYDTILATKGKDAEMSRAVLKAVSIPTPLFLRGKIVTLNFNLPQQLVSQ